jgi:hypothetical protein
MGKRQQFSRERAGHRREMSIYAIMLPVVFVLYVLFAMWQPGFVDNLLANLKSGVLSHVIF